MSWNVNFLNKLKRKIAPIKSRFVYVERGQWKKKLGERGKKERGKCEERENIRKLFKNITSWNVNF